MNNGVTCINSVIIDHPFFLYQTHCGSPKNANHARSEALAVSYGKGITKGHVLRRKHQQFHGHVRVQ